MDLESWIQSLSSSKKMTDSLFLLWRKRLYRVDGASAHRNMSCARFAHVAHRPRTFAPFVCVRSRLSAHAHTKFCLTFFAGAAFVIYFVRYARFARSAHKIYNNLAQ